MNRKMIRHAMVALALTGAVTGCATKIQTMTSRPSDTYYRWDGRMDAMPFVFHLPDGRTEAFDGRGAPWPTSAAELEADKGRRVEIFVGRFAGPGASMCGDSPKLMEIEKDDGKKVPGNVVAALCDSDRTVVSYIDRAKPHAIEQRKSYVAAARFLLLEGLWGATSEDTTTSPYS